MPKQDREFLSIPEFAAALNISTACARRWVLKRKIAVVKLGRLVRIPESEVRRLVSVGLRPARNLASPDVCAAAREVIGEVRA